MRLEDATKDYLSHIKHEQGVATSTYDCYGSWLRHLLRWYQANGYPDPRLSDFNTSTLRRFAYYLSETRHHRPRTLRGAFYPIKGLARFLVQNGALTENPCANLILPKKDAAQRKTVTDEEVTALLEACERQHDPRRVALCRALLFTLIFGGLRRSECLDLKTGDVNLKEKSLLIRCGKGSKSRRVFLPERCIAALAEWLIARGECSHDWIWALDKSRRVRHIALQTLLEEVKAIAGFAGRDNILPHSLRHWRATDLMKSGADIRSIQQFLGHSDIQTTAVYLHTNEEQLRSISEKTALRPATSQASDSPEPQRDRSADRSRSRFRRTPR